MRQLLTALLLMVCTLAGAQKAEKVEGHAVIYHNDDITPAEARRKVVEQARFEAIKEKFGANISQNNISLITEENGTSNASVFMLGESDLRGTWVRDTKEPRVETHLVEGRTVYEAWVEGEARELVQAPVDFKWKLLANGKTDRYEAMELHEDDDFYITFQSPVSGYLMVFVADDKETVNLLIPDEGEEYCQVRRNEVKLLVDDPDRSWVATLPENRNVEYDQLYVIFSPNELHPPITKVKDDNSDLKADLRHVAELSFKDFHKYLGKLRKDPKLQMEKMLVKISRKE